MDFKRITMDSVLYHEMIDEKLMKLGVPKISSDKYLHLVNFDQQYIDRFQRILD